MSELASRLGLAFKAVYYTEPDHRGYLECPFCDNSFKAIKSHIIRCHGIPLDNLENIELDTDSQLLVESENYFHKNFNFRTNSGRKIK
jgi:hypothetical protein